MQLFFAHERKDDILTRSDEYKLYIDNDLHTIRCNKITPECYILVEQKHNNLYR